MLFDPMPVSLGFAVNQKEKKAVSEDKCPGWGNNKKKQDCCLTHRHVHTYFQLVLFF